MECAICRFSISKEDRRAKFISMWKEEGSGQAFQVRTTGQVAHVVCLEGKPYDARQMSMELSGDLNYTIDMREEE